MNESEIVEGLRCGTPDAFRNLYQTHGRSVLTYLVRVTGRQETAEELAQETFLAVIRKIGFFKSSSDGGLKAWIFRIATHLAIDVLRREKKMRLGRENDLGTELSSDLLLNPMVDAHTPHEELMRIEFSENLQRALLELNAPQRMVFLLREQEGMSHLEISRVCGCSENAVKQGIFRARSALRKKLCE